MLRRFLVVASLAMGQTGPLACLLFPTNDPSAQPCQHHRRADEGRPLSGQKTNMLRAKVENDNHADCENNPVG